LQVKEIGVEGEEDERESGGRRVEPVPRQTMNAGAGSDVRKRRWNDGGKAGSPPPIVLHEGQKKDVRQWQPH
jgi:hypothetical protein